MAESRKSTFYRSFLAAGERTNELARKQMLIALDSIDTETGVRILLGLFSAGTGYAAGLAGTFFIPKLVERPLSPKADFGTPFMPG